ncbi:MAG: PadR family transcriptional regulator [Dehalococcoidia bacterium]
MRRKPGTLLPLEVSILEAALLLRAAGAAEFHGYLIAGKVKERAETKSLTAHGTLYKALDRMQTAGLIASRWEDPQVAADEERPRRRFYHVTASGEGALVDAQERAAIAKLASQQAVPA